MRPEIREQEELKMEEDIKPPKKYMDSSMYKPAREGNFTGLENSTRQKHGGNREEEALLDRLLLETRKGNNLIHLAAESGHKDFIEQVLRKCPQLVAKPNSCGDTPLHVAARTGLSDIVEAGLSKAKLHRGTPTTDTPGTRQMKEMEDGGAATIKTWRRYVHCYAIAAVLTCIALQSTAISFLSGLVAVLPDQAYVHTMNNIVGSVFHVSSCLFLFRLAQIFSFSEICLSLISRLRRLERIINSHIVNK